MTINSSVASFIILLYYYYYHIHTSTYIPSIECKLTAMLRVDDPFFVLLPGIFCVDEPFFVFLRGAVPRVIFFHASRL